MIYNVEGDILLSHAQAIVHGVGINDPMDKGLALKLFNKYPLLQKDFNRWCHQHNSKPGEAWMWAGPNQVRIINLITHEWIADSGNSYFKATLNNIKHALSASMKIIAFSKLRSIAVPKLGTGLGDLDWEDVQTIIEMTLGELNIPVYLYVVYRPDQSADELVLI